MTASAIPARKGTARAAAWRPRLRGPAASA